MDEINFAVKKDRLIEALRIVQGSMEMNIPGWRVPIEIGIEVGDKWGRTFPFKWDEGKTKLVPKYEVVGFEPEEKDDDIEIEMEEDEIE